MPGSPLLALTLAPLSRALVVARRGSGTNAAGDLPNRLMSVLKGITAGLGKAPSPAAQVTLPMTAEELASGLNKALYIASREKDRQAAQVAAAAWSALLRLAASASEPEGARGWRVLWTLSLKLLGILM